MEEKQYTHLVIIFLMLLVILNLFILDLYVFSNKPLVKISDINTTLFATVIPTNPPSDNPMNRVCPNSCLTLINDATKSSSALGGNENNQSQQIVQSLQIKTPREYYIPLGSGSTTKNNFDNLTATETTIDPNNYGTIKEAYFIASLRNPTQNGQVETQIYNVTDNHPVWGSQVIMKGPVSQTITSDKITLAQGLKLYRVQLKSTLSFDAYLDNAKIRIIAD